MDLSRQSCHINVRIHYMYLYVRVDVRKMLQDMPEYIILGQATFQGIRQSKCQNAFGYMSEHMIKPYVRQYVRQYNRQYVGQHAMQYIRQCVRMDISEIRVHTCQQFYQQLILTMVNTQSKAFSFSVYIIYIYICTMDLHVLFDRWLFDSISYSKK